VTTPLRLGVDYASARPGGAALASSGFSFVVRYLSSGGAGLPGKQLAPWEADELRDHGVSIVANWETYAARMNEGYTAGQIDATAAASWARQCGMPDNRPIYFSADWDVSPEQQVNVNAYLSGAASVLGAANVGIYGGFWSISRALDAGAAAWAWQTEGWSGGNLEPRRQLHQRLAVVVINGVSCDVNEALTDDFGQWDYEGAAMPTLDDYAAAVWAHRPTKLDGTTNTATAGDMLVWIDKHAAETEDLIAGPGTKDVRDPVTVTPPGAVEAKLDALTAAVAALTAALEA
jgi:hypothetical protein